jgi:hypothetical protein
LFHHGGTDTLAGEELVKNVEYADQTTGPFIKKLVSARSPWRETPTLRSGSRIHSARF